MSHPASPRCRRAALSHSAAEGSPTGGAPTGAALRGAPQPRSRRPGRPSPPAHPPRLSGASSAGAAAAPSRRRLPPPSAATWARLGLGCAPPPGRGGTGRGSSRAAALAACDRRLREEPRHSTAPSGTVQPLRARHGPIVAAAARRHRPEPAAPGLRQKRAGREEGAGAASP